MAWLNDIPIPGSQPYTGKEPEQTEWTELNQHSSIMINGDEEELNWHEVTFKDFLNYICKKPEWLYGKLWMIHEWYKDIIKDCKAQLADSKLNRQAKDGEIILMKNWLNKTTECLNQMTFN